LNIDFALARLANHGAKRVDDYNAGIGLLHLLGDCFQYSGESLFHQNLAQVDKADGAIQLEDVKERILLLVAQHFERGFAQHCEIKRGSFRRCVCEDKLMRQRGFATSRSARDDIK
jgi:hypothetical protein